MSNGFETCDQHTYLFATEGKDCPYCRIEQLEQELAEFKQWQKEDHDKLVQQVQTIDVLEQELQKTQLHLMEEETTRKIWEQDCKKAESQLVEAKHSYEVLKITYTNLEKTHYETTYDRVQRLESQLAEARAENSHLWVRVESGEVAAYEQGKAEARQEAAREIIALMGGWSLQNSTLITCRGIVARHFGLEG